MKSSELKYRTVKTTDQYTLKVKIRLSDDCHNGHADFAITGDFYDYVNGGHCCGCIHEIIEAICPELKPFINLHLCDAKGAPMYAQGNGFYHLRNSSREVTWDSDPDTSGRPIRPSGANAKSIRSPLRTTIEPEESGTRSMSTSAATSSNGIRPSNTKRPPQIRQESMKAA